MATEHGHAMIGIFHLSLLSGPKSPSILTNYSRLLIHQLQVSTCDRRATLISHAQRKLMSRTMSLTSCLCAKEKILLSIALLSKQGDFQTFICDSVENRSYFRSARRGLSFAPHFVYEKIFQHQDTKVVWLLHFCVA